MITDKELIYFLLRSSNFPFENFKDNFRTRLCFQKIVCLIQETGILETSFNFNYYHRGYYSANVADFGYSISRLSSNYEIAFNGLKDMPAAKRLSAKLKKLLNSIGITSLSEINNDNTAHKIEVFCTYFYHRNNKELDPEAAKKWVEKDKDFITDEALFTNLEDEYQSALTIS